jgi:exosome complex component RRP42
MWFQMLEVGGSLLDTLSIGVRAALQSTLVPYLTVTGEGEEMEIEVSDNPHDSIPINAEGAPIFITLHQVTRPGGAWL